MTSRERRVVRLGAATIVSAVFLLRLAPLGVRRVARERQDLLQQASLLAHARAELLRVPALRDSATLVRRELATLPAALLAGRTPRSAAADLARRLSVVVPRERAQLLSVGAVRDSISAGSLGRVTVRATVHTDVEGLGQLLLVLNRGTEVLVVREIRVVAKDPSAPDHRPELLQVRLTVSGWYARTVAQHTAGGA